MFHYIIVFGDPMDKEALDEYIKKHTKAKEKTISFVEYLYFLMDKYHFENASDLYNKANISRQLWSSIISNKSHPSLNVCIKIIFALRADNHECKYLLKKAGYTLPSSSKFALIIRYALETKEYDLNAVNEMLQEYGYIDIIE